MSDASDGVVLAALGDTADRGAAAAWRRTPWALRAAVVVVAAVLAVELLDSLFGSVLGTRTAPLAASSPYAAGPVGTGALVAMLARAGHPVAIATSPLGAATVPRGAVLLVVDPLRWTATDRAVASGVAATGGRVVFVGAAPSHPGPELANGDAVSLREAGVGPVRATRPSALTYGVAALATGVGALRTAGAVRSDVSGAPGTFVASDGPVVWVASAAPLLNANLGRLDDAALAWNLAAPPGRAVVIDAADMTPAPTTTGLRALPTWWFAALAVAGLAAVVWLASAARRFGPLERATRPLPPARVGHATAMGALLAATPASRVGEVAAPVADAARRGLLRRLRLDDAAERARIDEDATANCVPAWVVHAATAPVASRDDAVAAGRALAWLSHEGEPT